MCFTYRFARPGDAFLLQFTPRGRCARCRHDFRHKRHGVTFFFFRDKIWSWEYGRFLTTPLKVFMPIEYYGGFYRDLFDDDCTYYLLLCLDFRRRPVKMFGSRIDWQNRFAQTWRTVEPFAAFYKMLLRQKAPVLKPNSPLLMF